MLDQLSERGRVELAELVSGLGVSQVTVRRDLATLEQQGLLRRVRGGAILPHGKGHEPPFPRRQTTRRLEKEQIAAAALDFVKDGETITLDVGTTTLALATLLSERANLTVLTPSLYAATVLAEHPSVRVVLSGGVLRSDERSLVGELAWRTFGEFNVDRLFLGVGGVHPLRGITEYNLDDAAVKHAMLAGAREVTVLADATKLGRVALARVARIGAIDRLVTDRTADEHLIAQLRRQGVAVVVAEGPTQSDRPVARPTGTHPDGEGRPSERIAR